MECNKYLEEFKVVLYIKFICKIFNIKRNYNSYKVIFLNINY